MTIKEQLLVELLRRVKQIQRDKRPRRYELPPRDIESYPSYHTDTPPTYPSFTLSVVY